MRAHGLNHTQIASVEIRTFHMATRLAGHAPASLDEFSYGIAYPVATMIVRGKIGPEELTPQALQDPDIQRISLNVQLIDDPELTARSVAQRWAAVTLVTMDGGRFAAPPRTPRGDRDSSLTDAEISEKFHIFSDDLLGVARAEKIESLSRAFDRLDPSGLAELFDLCLTPTIKNV